METAIRLNLPVIIHDRDSHREILDNLSKKAIKRHRGVIHCFSGDYEVAMTFIDMGYYISIPGTVTYKKAVQLQEVASKIPIDRILNLFSVAKTIKEAQAQGKT